MSCVGLDVGLGNRPCTGGAAETGGEIMIGEQALDRRAQGISIARRDVEAGRSPSTITSVWPRVRVQTTALPIAIASRIVVIPAWKSVS